MKTWKLFCLIGSIALWENQVAIAQPPIDLRGKVMAATGDAGLGGVRVSLLAAGASDTTDASGVFRILVDPAAVRRPQGEGGPGLSREANLEAFDLAGRLIRSGGRDRQSPHVVRESGETGRQATAPLAKASAAVDTLLVTRAGFRAAKLPVTAYQMELEPIRLQADTSSFAIRVPAERTLTCGATTRKALDMDLVCESDNDSLRATIYIQSRPTACGAMSAILYTAENAWIKTAEGIQPLPQAVYDGGGNHRNDRVTFAWNGRFFSFYHASFGFGWRACTRPHCMQICGDLECRTVRYDGCSRATCAARPALKVRCAVVAPNGTVPNPQDHWTEPDIAIGQILLPCPGDPVCR